jgi:glycine reductase
VRLDLATFDVGDVRFGRRTAFEAGVLEIDGEELRDRLRGGVIEDVTIDLARPGEAVRLVHLLDTVEPRVRVTSPGSDFPGFLSPPLTVGEGRTNRLGGVAVMQSAVHRLVQGEHERVGQQVEPGDGAMRRPGPARRR